MPSSELRDAVRTNLLESLLGLVLVGTGGALAFAQAVSVRFGGYVVSTTGTVLISWALTRAWVSRQHHQELTRSLQAITRPLSTVASQLNYAVHRALSGGDDGIDTNLVASAVQHVFGVLTDLQNLIGSPIKVEDIIAIRDRLAALGEELAAAEPPEVAESAEDAVEVKQKTLRLVDEINSIKLQLESAVAKRDRHYRNETASCPRCGTPAPVSLGSLPGDSALPTCAACGTRFHVHRGTDGGTFTKPWGGAPSTTIEVSCSHCANRIPLTVRSEGAEPQQRYCLKCFAKLVVDPQTQTATTARAPQEPLTGILSPDHLKIACPQCRRSYKTIYGRDGVYFAVCPPDDSLLRAGHQVPSNAPTVPAPE